MFRQSLSTIFLCMSLTWAAPHPYNVAAGFEARNATEKLNRVITEAVPPPGGPKVVLTPGVHPELDQGDVMHLKQKTTAQLFYSEDTGPSIPFSMSMLTIPGTTYPVVQLENSGHVESIFCSSTSAMVKFSNPAAYATAADDWQEDGNFVLITYDPSCGTGFDSNKRDFLLVSKVTLDPSMNLIHADIKHIDFPTAVGGQTVITADIGTYVPPQAKRWSHSKTWDFNNFATSDTTQWGPGVQLLSTQPLTVDCVGCGLSGSIIMTGSVSFKWYGGIDSASFETNGNIHAALQVGVIANELTAKIPIASVNLLTIPLGALDIPFILTIGPQITVSAGVGIDLAATGKMLVGATLDWPSFNAKLDLQADSATASGFTPTVTPVAQFAGSISASLDFHLPIGIGIGINVADGHWNKQIALVNTPGVKLTSTAANVSPCVGSAVSASVYDTIGINLLDLTSVTLAQWEDTLFSKCLSPQVSTTGVVTSTMTTTVATTSSIVTTSSFVATSAVPTTSTKTTSSTPTTTSITSSTSNQTSSHFDHQPTIPTFYPSIHSTTSAVPSLANTTVSTSTLDTTTTSPYYTATSPLSSSGSFLPHTNTSTTTHRNTTITHPTLSTIWVSPIPAPISTPASPSPSSSSSSTQYAPVPSPSPLSSTHYTPTLSISTYAPLVSTLTFPVSTYTPAVSSSMPKPMWSTVYNVTSSAEAPCGVVYVTVRER